MRALAHVENIIALNPIPNADKIEVATVLGWQCVVKKNEFKVGDLIVYIEVDSLLPAIPIFDFMAASKYRVRTIKLRGQISQGLVCSMKALPEGKYSAGQDVTDLMKIKQYNPADAKEEVTIPVRGFFRKQLYKLYRVLNKHNSEFPSFLSKTDEERIQNITKLLYDDSLRTCNFEVTEKLDGTSATYYVRGKEFGICSRNRCLAKPFRKWQVLRKMFERCSKDDSKYWQMAFYYDIEHHLQAIRKQFNAQTVVVQGEIVGSGIQGNKYCLQRDFFVFNLIIDGKRYSTVDMNNILACRLNRVPLLNTTYLLPDTVFEIVEYSKGQSTLCKETIREGIVVRNVEKNISFKCINPDFLLKYDD